MLTPAGLSEKLVKLTINFMKKKNEKNTMSFQKELDNKDVDSSNIKLINLLKDGLRKLFKQLIINLK